MSPASVMINPLPFQSRVLKATDECTGVKTFRLEVPAGFTFKPGMWVMVNFPDAPKPARAYSISSSPFDKGFIEISLNDAGGLSGRLFNLKAGDPLTLRGPYGKWFYHEEQRAALISGGTGLTPFRSICRYVLDKKLPNKLTLLYSCRTPAEILYKAELKKFVTAGIKVYTAITRPELMKSWESWSGPVGRIGIDVISKQVDDFAACSYYLCGPISMVEDLTAALLNKGIPREHIRTEKWGDYQI